jgi:heme exporter protein D
MEWGSWHAFWAMGGYAPYVWGSYGVTALVLALEIAMLRWRSRQALAAVRRSGRPTGDAP